MFVSHFQTALILLCQIQGMPSVFAESVPTTIQESIKRGAVIVLPCDCRLSFVCGLITMVVMTMLIIAGAVYAFKRRDIKYNQDIAKKEQMIENLKCICQNFTLNKNNRNYSNIGTSVSTYLNVNVCEEEAAVPEPAQSPDETIRELEMEIAILDDNKSEALSHPLVELCELEVTLIAQEEATEDVVKILGQGEVGKEKTADESGETVETGEEQSSIECPNEAVFAV